jgi:replication-associated recombination protein RarA
MKNLVTVRKYDFFEVSSAMQKAIRRGDAKIAGYFAHELIASNFWEYVWRRLLTISAEDVFEPVTQEVLALYQGWKIVNNKKEKKGRIFISKAVLLLCRAVKSRDADHLQCLVYDQMMGIGEDEINEALGLASYDQYQPIPDYAYDCHTQTGRSLGRTKGDFFREEHAALKPRQPGLFDHLAEQQGDLFKK